MSIPGLPKTKRPKLELQIISKDVINQSIIDKIKLLEIPEENIKRISDLIKTYIPNIEENPYLNIYNMLKIIRDSFKYMNGDVVKQIYTELEEESQIDLHFDSQFDSQFDSHIEYTIVHSPISDRLIAHVTILRWNGENLLRDDEHLMLYKSTGKSRLTGLDNIWLPYKGEKFDKQISKLEDDYITAINQFDLKNPILHDLDRRLLNEIVYNILSYYKYQRFIYKKYAIASYLLHVANINDAEHIKVYTDEQKSSAQRLLSTKIMERRILNNFIDYIPITQDFIDEILQAILQAPLAPLAPLQNGGNSNKYYSKYLKYKNKYINLCNMLL
jgi:hypothetical protein